MKPIIIPESHNYIAVFLTLACNLRCSYCINRFEAGNFKKGHISGEEWVKGLNRIVSRPDLPVSLQGGEPSLHPDIFYILNNIKPELNIDLLTNLQFDIDAFMSNVSPDRIKRDAPYASIRVSYHPETMQLQPLVDKVLKMMKAGYSIGIWGVMHPKQEAEILRAQEYCKSLGIDFRTKEFLGEYEGKQYGTYRYEGSCDKKGRKNVMCKTTELIIGPTGGIYRCHSDLYEGRQPIGNITDPEFEIEDKFRPCADFGHCNPCDVKLKTNRFQIFGHTSVEVEF
ncbi:MAG: radical SAM protein [Nitrospirae bacterium]|nr:MAG: radical SAM protein [Nitrospirota bacterium]